MTAKERIYSLSEIITGIGNGGIKDGALFVNTLGEQAVVEQGGLRWYQSKNYMSGPVAVTADTITDYWKQAELKPEAGRTFQEALPLIAEGRTVTLVTAQGVNYTVNSLKDVENLIVYSEALEDLYNSQCIAYKTVAKTEEPARIGRATGNKDKKQRKGRKLTAEDVTAIRAHFAHGVHSLVLAERYGVSQRMIHYIVKGQYWGKA